MKRLKTIAFFLTTVLLFSACKKDLPVTTAAEGTAPTLVLSSENITLSSLNETDTVLRMQWNSVDFGFSAAVDYSIEVVNANNTFADATSLSPGSAKSFSFLGTELNDLAIGLGIPVNNTGIINVRIKAALNEEVVLYSNVVKLTVKTYIVQLPALLVRGGNAWSTPVDRTNGFVLTSPNYSGLYEGYIYLPNANGWGGDALKLEDEKTKVVYGWGGSATTIAAGASGNLWFTPAPNYMRVIADIVAGTVSFTPVQFFIAGNHNNWSTSATPMTYNATTRQWVATNVNFTAGNSIVFTSNGNYNISYKINNEGKLVYAGPPSWSGSNIPVPGTGSYTVILDVSGGNGNYTYSIQ